MKYNFELSDFTNGNYVNSFDCPVARLAKRVGLTQNPSVSIWSLSDYKEDKYWRVENATLNGEDQGTFDMSVYKNIGKSIKNGTFKEATVEIFER